MSWLTTKQVAVELKVTARTVEKWRETGYLRPKRRTRGNHSRYTEEQICKLKNQRLLKQLML